jgi:DNA-binding transcriptional LysR family regulator
MAPNPRTERKIKLRDLEVLTAVAETGSMNRAASRLNTVQPAVSRSIAELERHFGVRLLDRLPQGVEPTAQGHALLNCAKAVFDDLRLGAEHVEFLTDPNAGNIRVGAVLPLAAGYLLTVIERLSQRYPGIVFDIAVGQQATLERELRERNIDVLIAWIQRGQHDNQLVSEFLFDDSFVVVAGAESRWARRRKISLSELVNERWTLPPTDSVGGAAFMRYLQSVGLNYPRTAVVAIPEEVRANLVVTGRYLSIWSSSSLEFSSNRSLKVLATTLSDSRLPVGFITLKNRLPSPAVRLFVECARDVAKVIE